MSSITITLCASTRTGCLSAAIPACAEVSLTLAGDITLSAGTSLALLTPRGTTLAHTILSEQAAPGAPLPLSTLTAQAAEYTRSCRAGDTREALLAIGDSEHPLALVPARFAQNPLYTLAPPTTQAPAYPTSDTLHALLAEVQAAALRAENAAAAVDAPALKAAIAQNADAIAAEANERAEADEALQSALDAEAEARAARDGEITEAVNAQADVLEQHQGYLSTLSTNYNNLASSYIQSVTDLQTKDASLESAIATKAEATHAHAIDDTTGLQAALDAKAEASALSAHAATWATGSTGGHVKLGTNSILSTADGNFGVVGKTSGNQLIYRMDAAPTSGSGLPVKSGGVYTALAALTERIAALESALTATIDGQTYRLQWSSTAGTFELIPLS